MSRLSSALTLVPFGEALDVVEMTMIPQLLLPLVSCPVLDIRETS